MSVCVCVFERVCACMYVCVRLCVRVQRIGWDGADPAWRLYMTIWARMALAVCATGYR